MFAAVNNKQKVTAFQADFGLQMMQRLVRGHATTIRARRDGAGGGRGASSSRCRTVSQGMHVTPRAARVRRARAPLGPYDGTTGHGVNVHIDIDAGMGAVARRGGDGAGGEKAQARALRYDGEVLTVISDDDPGVGGGAKVEGRQRHDVGRLMGRRRHGLGA